MADYSVDIQAKLSGFEKVNALEKQLNALEKKTVKINVDVDGKNFNSKHISKQLQSSFDRSIKSVKFNNPDTFYKNYFDQAKKDIKEAKNINKTFSKELESINTDNVNKNALKIAKARSSAELKATQEYINSKRKILNGYYDAKSSSIKSKLDSYKGQDSDIINSARKEAELYNTTLSKLKDHFDSTKSFSMNDEEVISSFNKMTLAAEKFDNIMTQVRNTESKSLGIGVAERSANSVKKYYDENSKAIKKYGVELKDLENRYRQASTVAEKADLDNKFKNLKASISAEGLSGKSPLEEIGRGFKQIGQFAVTYGAIQRIPELIGNMAKEVLSVDTAMTNLYKVTDETNAKYNEFLSNAGTNAKSLGRDISSYITQTSKWAKLGYSMESSSELAKVSSIYSNVGEVDDKTAVSDLVTVMKAYKMQDSQAMDIADMLNELGNNYATSAGDLGAGLNKMASTMSMSNVSLEKSLAILTGGTEITQNAKELGNAIKVSVLRMRGQKGALEQLGENADDIESVSKMQTQILNMTEGAVNIMDSADPTSFRDYYDVMADIAEVLPRLKQTDQADLIETLFGKNRANQGQAILQAFQSGQIQKAYQTALNAEGSAQAEQDKWLQSLEADFCLVA